jgi:hypothetical protein
MESPHSQDTNGGEERTSPKGATFDRDTLLDLVRSIVRHPAVKDATVEMVRDGLSQPAEARMSDGIRAGATEALTHLSDRLRGGVKDAIDALSEDDWTQIAREMLEDAQEVNEAASVA